MKKSHVSQSMSGLQEQNQFMNPPNSGKISKEQQHLYSSMSKDLRIQRLQERNNKLKREVKRFQKALQEIQQPKITYGIKLPEIKNDIINKELQNAYKMIKIYEKEISKKKKMDNQVSYIEQLKTNEVILKEKEDLTLKLNGQMNSIKKRMIQYTKLLKNDSLKEDYLAKISAFSSQIKWLRQKIKEADEKKSSSEINYHKQQQFIVKLEKQLLEMDFPKYQMDIIKDRIYSTPDPNDSLEEPVQISKVKTNEINIEEKSQQIHSYLVNQIKLFKKLETDYAQKINLMTKEKQNASQRNLKARNRLLEVEHEIQTIENEMKELKVKIDPKAMKPMQKHLLPSSKQVKIQKPPKPAFQHSFKFIDFGKYTKAGKRFSDRSSIGKFPSKIISIELYQTKSTPPIFVGWQATYLIKQISKKSSLNLLLDKKQVQTQSSTLNQNDFFKSVDIFFDQKGKIVGISMVSRNNVILKAGNITLKREILQMLPDEYPICLYGCILQNGLQMFGVEFDKEE